MPYQHVAVSVTPLHLSELIKAVELACLRGVEEPLGRIGMSAVNWQALRLISQNPRARQCRLARLTDHSHQAFGTLLARMVTYQFVARREARGRAPTHELTRLGEILLQMGNEIVEDVLARLFGTLSDDECETLQRLLNRVLLARWRLQLDPLPRPTWYNTGMRPPA
jgi:DNA-binding MarR family transcriptional regulator